MFKTIPLPLYSSISTTEITANYKLLQHNKTTIFNITGTFTQFTCIGQSSCYIVFVEVSLMTAKKIIVCPQNIVTYYNDEIKGDETANRIIHAENVKKDRVISLVVEEATNGQLILLEKFEYHAALLKANPNTRRPCLVYPASNEVERIIHILTVTIPLEKGTSWSFKNYHVAKLINDYGMAIEKIARVTNCDVAKIQSYILDERIPEYIRNQVIKMKAKTVVEKICRSRIIPESIKGLLYDRAVLDQGSLYRLNEKKFEYMKEFFAANHIPHPLANNSQFMQSLIDDLLYNNFRISHHMRQLLHNFPTIRIVK